MAEVVGNVASIVSLAQQVQFIAICYQRLKDDWGHDRSLIIEIKALQDTLLSVRDLVEQQGIEEVKVHNLTILAQQTRGLGTPVDELELELEDYLSSMNSSSHSRTRDIELLEQVKECRRNLDLLLSTFGTLPPTNSSARTSQSANLNPSAKTVKEWFNVPDVSESFKTLKELHPTKYGDWVLENALFQRWLKEPGKRLWCTGQAGSGKTTLCTMLIGHLCEIMSLEKTPVIFALFRLDDRSQDREGHVKSLIIQLLQYCHDMPEALTEIYDKNMSLSTSPPLLDLWVCLSSIISQFDRVFIFFDALDEYGGGPERFSDDFNSLLDMPNTSLFVTSRPTLMNKTALQAFEVLDIRAEGSNDHEFSRMLQGLFCRGDRSVLATEILLWLTYSRRPLTLPQLQAAVGVRLGSDDFDPDDVPLIDEVKEICSNEMITVEPQLQRVSLMHYALSNWLHHIFPAEMTRLPGPDEPDTFIAKKCLTFLRWNAFSRDVPSEPGELHDRLAHYPFLSYAARYWGEHAQRGTPRYLMEDIMTLFDSSHKTMSTGLAMSAYEQHPSHYEGAYQGMSGLHISAYFGLTEVATQLLDNGKCHPDVTTTGGWTALHWAARRGLAPMVSTLLSHNASPAERTKLDGWTILHLAAKEGHLDVLMELIDANVDINSRDVNLRTPLYLASWGGHTDIVRHLLQAQADPNVPNAYGATVLHCAAKRGYADIVSQLLATDIDVNVVDKSGVTALDEAVRKQNKDIITMLAEVGAQTRWNMNKLPSEIVIDDLNWGAYTINDQRTAMVQKGMQCICHVLEKDSERFPSTSPAMVFRKTFSLTADNEGLVKKYLESERMILQRLRHPNVVAYLDFDEDPDQNSVLLYMEYCDLGDLETCHGRRLTTGSDTIEDDDDDDEDGNEYGFYEESTCSREATTALDPQNTWSLIAQLSMALAYLHYGLTVKLGEETWEAYFESSWHNVIHRDIKPANVVMQSSESDARIFKLCDLGIAAEAGKGSGHNTTQYIGSQSFRPPEVSGGRRWSTKGDIWSLGATIRELKKLKDPKLDFSIQILIDKCTHNKPIKRPSSLEMLQEAFEMLESHQLMEVLPVSSRLQIQAVHSLLSGGEGSYLMQAFNLVAELLDDIVPFKSQLAKDRRKEVIERLYLLWNDGVEQCFQNHLNDFSLHILVLLPLSPKARSKHIPNVIKSASLNNRWERSRWTPLHLAVQQGNEEVVKELLRNGADKAKEDLHGCTPRYYTKTLPSIAALLQ